jgi:hypothetical protein
MATIDHTEAEFTPETVELKKAIYLAVAIALLAFALGFGSGRLLAMFHPGCSENFCNLFGEHCNLQTGHCE